MFIFLSLLDQTHTPIVLYCILTSCVKLTSCSSIQHDCGHVHNMYLNDFNLAFVNALFIYASPSREYHYGYFSKHYSFKITWNVIQSSLTLHGMWPNLPYYYMKCQPTVKYFLVVFKLLGVQSFVKCLQVVTKVCIHFQWIQSNYHTYTIKTTAPSIEVQHLIIPIGNRSCLVQVTKDRISNQNLMLH